MMQLSFLLCRGFSKVAVFIALVLAIGLTLGVRDRTSAKGSAVVVQPSAGENLYIDAQGAKFTGPPVLPKPSASVGAVPDSVAYRDTGPYYRVSAKLGFSFFSGNVFLPCRAGNFASGEVGFVYTGGWGAGKQGAAVDAGFQKSSIQDGSTNDNYALFLRISEPNQYLGTQYPQRFRCNQDVLLEFGPFKAGLLTVRATGIIIDGTTITVPIDTKLNAASGWKANGGGSSDGVLVKRMTSIGQPPGWSGAHFLAGSNANWDSSGTFFGHEAASKLPLIRWHDYRLGALDPLTGNLIWVGWTEQNTLREDKWPVDPTRIINSFEHTTDDSVAIDLHP